MKRYEAAKELGVDPATISRDIAYLVAQSQNYLNSLAKETLPFMYQTSIEGIRDVIKECWRIYESESDEDKSSSLLQIDINRNVKLEDLLVRLLVYAGLTAYSYNPLCIGIRAPTTEGKTYAVIQSILKYFPKGDYLLIGSISPKALIRQHGIMVDKDNYQPLEPKINELKKQIRESKTNGEKEDLQQQLDQISKEAKYLIDLSGKFYFSLSPHILMFGKLFSYFIIS